MVKISYDPEDKKENSDGKNKRKNKKVLECRRQDRDNPKAFAEGKVS
jgi:hypothetical protein